MSQQLPETGVNPGEQLPGTGVNTVCLNSGLTLNPSLWCAVTAEMDVVGGGISSEFRITESSWTGIWACMSTHQTVAAGRAHERADFRKK